MVGFFGRFSKGYFLTILACTVITLSFFTISLTYNSPFLLSNPGKTAGSVKAFTASEVPELTGILSSDQKTRIESTKSLAERVGVEDALEIVERSSLPHTGEGHLAVHQIGFHAYKVYNKDAILHCKDYFLYACYHGAIIEAATDHGFPIIKEMTDRCKSYASRYFQCVHAAGHAIMAIWNYDLDDAVKTCDQLFESETQFADTLSSCHNGAFMENLFGVHDWDKGERKDREWLSSDPFFPCNAFGEKYQKGCWLNQAARIYQLNNGDIGRTAYICQAIGNQQYTIWCLDNLARQIHPLTEGNINKVFALCEQVGIGWRDNCVVVNAGSYYSVGDRETAIKICNQIPYSSKSDCYGLIGSQIASDIIETSDKIKLCRLIDDQYEKQCLVQIGI